MRAMRREKAPAKSGFREAMVQSSIAIHHSYHGLGRAHILDTIRGTEFSMS